MSTTKIPKQLPSSVLAQPPARSFAEQYNNIPSRVGQSAKLIEQKETEWERTRSEKGISERLLSMLIFR